MEKISGGMTIIPLFILTAINAFGIMSFLIKLIANKD